MIPNSFEYVQAGSIEEAIRLMQESGGEGKFIAGGHSLVPLMKFRLTNPGKLIDISQITDLRGIRKEGNRLVVGALTTHKQLYQDELVKQNIPVLAEAARTIGDMQVRNRGTVGGNLAHADSAADLPGVALALDAFMEVQGEDGKESLDAEGFFLGPLVTALPETSVLASVSFLIPPAHAKSVYLKYAHPASGYAVVGVCAIAGVGQDGRIDFVRIGINGAADIAYRATSVEQALLGEIPTADTIRLASALAANEGEIGSDLFASEEYRRHLASVYTQRALTQILL
ncbi:FAD binding domain-containing protein [Brevibacillus choshinensis]|uniref:Xanthine dehydrogenase family protein subunit M n=1 Tax=Brevibacillus choshinensis TaxID=54911 RepID=A0ABX7FJZ1_BRECH|nr:xanthine dehydrogenase family protein subunit M [Brevibacillus choshinensis]QRG65945.1 xanthine dehydrogenase family protein subunit M [Brevibacillus choshinensis]